MLQIAAGSKGIHLPGQHSICDWIITMAEESLKNSLLAIPARNKVAIALDCWSSQSGKAFLAVTCYFFTEGFQYREILLGFEPLLGSHDGRYLAQVVAKLLDKHGLLYRVIAVTTDGASNNFTMMASINEKVAQGISDYGMFQEVFDQDVRRICNSSTHIPCLAHIIQLSVNALLDTLKVSARNDDSGERWNDQEDKKINHTYGLPSTLEKVTASLLITTSC